MYYSENSYCCEVHSSLHISGSFRTLAQNQLGAVCKGRPANREGVVLKFRTFPDVWRGEVVCESSDVRKFLKKSKFQNFSELFKVKTRNYNRSRFQFVC